MSAAYGVAIISRREGTHARASVGKGVQVMVRRLGAALTRLLPLCVVADVANSLDHMLISPVAPSSGGGDPKKGRAEDNGRG